MTLVTPTPVNWEARVCHLVTTTRVTVLSSVLVHLGGTTVNI